MFQMQTALPRGDIERNEAAVGSANVEAVGTTGSLNSSCFSHLVLLASCLLRVPLRSGGLRDGAVHGEHPQRHEVADRRRRRVPSCVHVAAPRSRGDRGGQGEVGRGTEI